MRISPVLPKSLHRVGREVGRFVRRLPCGDYAQKVWNYVQIRSLAAKRRGAMQRLEKKRKDHLAYLPYTDSAITHSSALSANPVFS